MNVELFFKKMYELGHDDLLTFNAIYKNPAIFVPILLLTEIFGNTGEELVFRYFAIKALRQNYNRRITVIALSSLIWTLMHGSVNWGHIVAGLVLGFLYYETESLAACIILHFLFNCTLSTVPFYIFYKELGRITLSPFQYGVTLFATQVIFYQLLGMFFLKVLKFKAIKDSPVKARSLP